MEPGEGQDGVNWMRACLHRLRRVLPCPRAEPWREAVNELRDEIEEVRHMAASPREMTVRLEIDSEATPESLQRVLDEEIDRRAEQLRRETAPTERVVRRTVL